MCISVSNAVEDEDCPSSSSSSGRFIQRQTDPDSTKRLKHAMITPPQRADKNSPMVFVLWCDDVDRAVDPLVYRDSLQKHWRKDLHYVMCPPV